MVHVLFSCCCSSDSWLDLSNKWALTTSLSSSCSSKKSVGMKAALRFHFSPATHIKVGWSKEKKVPLKSKSKIKKSMLHWPLRDWWWPSKGHVSKPLSHTHYFVVQHSIVVHCLKFSTKCDLIVWSIRESGCQRRRRSSASATCVLNKSRSCCWSLVSVWSGGRLWKLKT